MWVVRVTGICEVVGGSGLRVFVRWVVRVTGICEVDRWWVGQGYGYLCGGCTAVLRMGGCVLQDVCLMVTVL